VLVLRAARQRRRHQWLKPVPLMVRIALWAPLCTFVHTKLAPHASLSAVSSSAGSVDAAFTVQTFSPEAAQGVEMTDDRSASVADPPQLSALAATPVSMVAPPQPSALVASPVSMAAPGSNALMRNDGVAKMTPSAATDPTAEARMDSEGAVMDRSASSISDSASTDAGEDSDDKDQDSDASSDDEDEADAPPASKQAQPAAAKAKPTSLNKKAEKRKLPPQPKESALAGDHPHHQTSLDAQGAVGKMMVYGPLPSNFSQVFMVACVDALGLAGQTLQVTAVKPLPAFFMQRVSVRHRLSHHNTGDAEEDEGDDPLFQVTFTGPKLVVDEVLRQAADPKSALAQGKLADFLANDEGDDDQDDDDASNATASAAAQTVAAASTLGTMADVMHSTHNVTAKAALPSGVTPADAAAHDVYAAASTAVDMAAAGNLTNASVSWATDMASGLHPFGHLSAKPLAEEAVSKSDEVVDQIENTEIREEKKAIHQVLGRLRGKMIANFDAIAEEQEAQIDEFAKAHPWRQEHLPDGHVLSDRS